MTLWIICAVILVIILTLFLLGYILYRKRTITIESSIDQSAHGTGKQLYKSTQTFVFSDGTPHQEVPVAASGHNDTQIWSGHPVIGDDATEPKDRDRYVIRNISLPEYDEESQGNSVSEKIHRETELMPDGDAGSIPIDTSDMKSDSVSILEQLRSKLALSHSAIGKSVLGLLGAGELDENSWQDIEDILLSGDIGVATAVTIIEKLRSAIAAQNIRTSDEVKALLIDILIDQLHPEYDRSIHALPHEGKPAVILIVGVNGTGKTSTAGKLAKVLTDRGVSVLLAAADTFRAAAADQLEIWAQRSGAQIKRGAEHADPSAVAFDAVVYGAVEQLDAIIVDTAGRLHTKVGLMDELGKIKRVVEKKAIVTEVLLVLDATIGQNGLVQARLFSEAVTVTGVVLTKLDGTAKGGIVFQVQNELQVPVKLVGLGEGHDDLAPFDPQAYVYALLG